MLQLDDVLSHGEQESEIPLTLLPVECLSDCVVYQLVLLSVDLIDQFDEQTPYQTDLVRSPLVSVEHKQLLQTFLGSRVQALTRSVDYLE